MTPAAACHRSGEESGDGGASLSNAAEASVAATLFKVVTLCVASLQSAIAHQRLTSFDLLIRGLWQHGRDPAAAFIQPALAASADAIELVSVSTGGLLMCDAVQASLQGLMRDFGYEVRSAVVLTPYRAQLGLLQREFQKVLGRGAKELAAVEFATVDGFQVGCCSSVLLVGGM